MPLPEAPRPPYVREEGKTKALPQKPLLRSPPCLPNPMIVGEDDPRIPRRPPTCDRLEEIKEPIDGPPYLVALHQGMGDGLLTSATRGLTETLPERATEAVGHLGPHGKGCVKEAPAETDRLLRCSTSVKTLPHPVDPADSLPSSWLPCWPVPRLQRVHHILRGLTRGGGRRRRPGSSPSWSLLILSCATLPSPPPCGRQRR